VIATPSKRSVAPGIEFCSGRRTWMRKKFDGAQRRRVARSAIAKRLTGGQPIHVGQPFDALTLAHGGPF
jgi:hypothetical protein